MVSTKRDMKIYTKSLPVGIEMEEATVMIFLELKWVAGFYVRKEPVTHLSKREISW